MINYFKNKFREFTERYRRGKETISDDNWNIKTAIACEDVVDAITREENGASQKITKAFAGKLGAAGTSVGIFSIASLIGTAGTGTAIGSLSGAALTSATLAWIGGSMFIGSVLLTVAAVAGGLGAALGAGFVFKKYVFGKKREKTELDEKEQNIIAACIALATAFRQKEKEGKPLDPLVVKALYGEALQPLCEELLEFQLKTKSWTSFAKRRIKNSIKVLTYLTNYLKVCFKNSPNVTIGTLSAVILQLLSETPHDLKFEDNEQLVLEALRGSNKILSEASIKDLGDYVKNQDPSQLKGLLNSITGKYHELRYQMHVNSTDDNLRVELFEEYNHPGADIKLINTETGEEKVFQLKATDYLSYIKKHNEKYEDISVLATEEVAKLDPDIGTTGISNMEIREEVSDVFDSLKSKDDVDFGVGSSMTVAAMITLARNVKVILKGSKMTNDEKSKLVQDGMIAAGVAGVISLLIG
jgi:hypothetical protein